MFVPLDGWLVEGGRQALPARTAREVSTAPIGSVRSEVSGAEGAGRAAPDGALQRADSDGPGPGQAALLPDDREVDRHPVAKPEPRGRLKRRSAPDVRRTDGLPSVGRFSVRPGM